MRYQHRLVNISLAKRSKPTAILNVCMYIRIYTPYSNRGQISLVVYWKWFYQCVWDSQPVYSFQQYSLYTRSSLENDRCRILIGHFKKKVLMWDFKKSLGSRMYSRFLFSFRWLNLFTAEGFCVPEQYIRLNLSMWSIAAKRGFQIRHWAI